MGYTQVELHKTMLREEVQQLKSAKVPKLEAYKRLTEEGKKLSWPTFLKYYNAEEVPTLKGMDEKYEKQKAFDVEPFRSEILRCLKANEDNKALKVSSIYDLLAELFVDSGKVAALPGNEQTLRNYIRFLKKKGVITLHEPSFREMDYVDEQTIPYGEQAQLDYGQEELLDGSVVHFIALELRRSRFLYVQPQDHPFTAEESVAAIYTFMVRIGGRFKTLVIDQDRCLVHKETYGELTLTRVFKDFLQEQAIGLYVCRAQDPQTKGQIEDLVKYVKSNYFSARLKTGLSMDEALEGILKWCDRKNAAVRLPFRKVPSLCLKEEAPSLRPLAASQYSGRSGTYTLSSVDKLGYITYLSNKYSVSKILRNTKVRTRVFGERLCIYELDSDTLITEHVISD